MKNGSVVLRNILEGRDKFEGRLGKFATEGGGQIRSYRQFSTARVVQAVLLFGAENWVLMGSNITKTLRGVHVGLPAGR